MINLCGFSQSEKRWIKIDRNENAKREFLLTFVLAHCYYLGVTIERIGSHRVCGCLTVLMVALMSYSSHCHYCCCHVERIRRRYHLDVNMMGLVVDCWEYLVCLCITKVKEKTLLKNGISQMSVLILIKIKNERSARTLSSEWSAFLRNGLVVGVCVCIVCGSRATRQRMWRQFNRKTNKNRFRHKITNQSVCNCGYKMNVIHFVEWVKSSAYKCLIAHGLR